jgi:hypothetical protein
MSKAWAAGSVPGWRRLRAVVLQRDDYTCQIKIRGCTIRANTVDHILGVEVSGVICDPKYLRAASAHCNYSRGKQDISDPPHVAVTVW